MQATTEYRSTGQGFIWSVLERKMIINNLFHHDRGFSEIHQQAFSSIVDGATIPSVRKRYNLCMDAYWQKHLWDD